MNFEYFDIHSHIYFPDFDKDREEEIQRIKDAKIGSITIGTDFQSSETAVDIANRHDNFFACVGQHPEDLTVDSVFDTRLKTLADNKKVVSIGETGLDYFRLPASPILQESLKIIQKNIFQEHIKLSLSSGKPLMLHIRSSKGTYDAYEEVLEILESQNKIFGSKLRGNAHFFAGNLDILKRLLDIGFTVSFTGVITFTHDYDELICFTPINMIMSETDSPFVAPVPYRGHRNSPLYIPEVVKKIADIRGQDFEVVKKALLHNTTRYFSI